MKFLRKLLSPSRSSPLAEPQRRWRIDLGDMDPLYSLYAIGDVHGCLKELLDAEERIRQDMAALGRSGLVILLGDYVDRGPQSCAVIEHLCSNSESTLRRLALCGNHDQAFLSFLRSPMEPEQWLEFGGRETLLSYGVDADYVLHKGGGRQALADIVTRAVPAHHVNFLENLPSCARIGSHFFVHAGVRPGVNLEDQTDTDFLWIREPFLSKPSGLPFTVVHGHTISSAPSFAPGRIGIDTGAYATGKLTVLRLVEGHATIL